MQDRDPDQLLVGIREAARWLSVSTRTLWSMTRPRGPVPCLRLGRRVLFRRRDLEEFLDSLARSGPETMEQGAAPKPTKRRRL
jgi:excisionase family DNA binding protein